MNDKREKVMELIKNLNNTINDRASTENEVMIATAKVQELMAKYNISEVTVDEDERAVEYSVTVGNEKWRRILANIIANNFFCKVYHDGNTIKFFGFDRHASVASEVFKYVYKYGNKKANAIYTKCRNNGEYTKGIKNAFLIGFLKGIASILEKQSTALMVITPPEVVEQFDEMCEKIGTRNRRCNVKYSSNAEVYNEGYKTGRQCMQERTLQTTN